MHRRLLRPALLALVLLAALPAAATGVTESKNYPEDLTGAFPDPDCELDGDPYALCFVVPNDPFHLKVTVAIDDLVFDPMRGAYCWESILDMGLSTWFGCSFDPGPSHLPPTDHRGRFCGSVTLDVPLDARLLWIRVGDQGNVTEDPLDCPSVATTGTVTVHWHD